MGGHGPPWPENSFILTIEATKIGVEPPPENWKMAGEPSPGAPESPTLEKFLPTPLSQFTTNLKKNK